MASTITTSHVLRCMLLTDREKGIGRCFTNDLVGHAADNVDVHGQDCFGRFGEFPRMELEFVNGYYYDAGFNGKIVDTMKHLFEQRLKCKSVDNPLQMVFTELMNSAYGKSRGTERVGLPPTLLSS